MINVLFLVLVVLVVKKLFFRGKKEAAEDRRSGFAVSLCREDGVSQIFFLFSVSLFGVFVLSLNAKAGEPLKGRDVFLLTALAALFAGYYFRALYTVVSGAFAVVIWWAVQAVTWASGAGVKAAAVMAGLFLASAIFYILGRIYGTMGPKYRRLSAAYYVPGMLAVIAVFFVFSTKHGLVEFSKILAGAPVVKAPKVLLSLGISLAAAMGLLSYGFKKKAFLSLEGVYLIVLSLLFAGFAFLPEQSLFLSKPDPYGLDRNPDFNGLGAVWAVFFNIAIFVQVVGVIFLGYFRKEDKTINIGAFLMALLIFVKYFDWFFDFMDKSVFFLGSGVLLFALGWSMERGRKYMLAAIKKEDGN